MKIAFGHICALLLLAGAARAAQLTSVQSSYHAYGNFAILVLRFDGEVNRDVQETENGSGVLITIPGCSLTPKASGELAAARNQLLKNAQAQGGGDHWLALRFEFAGPMKLRVSDTNNPRSMILDISPRESKTVKLNNTAQIEKKKPTGTLKKPAPSSPPLPTGNNAADYIARGKQALARKNEHEAMTQFEKALRLSPDSPEVHYLLGLLQRKWGHPTAALPHFQKAKADSKYLPLASTELASIYHELGRTIEEVAEWEAFFASMKRSYSLPDSLIEPQEELADTAQTPPSMEAETKPARISAESPEGDSITSLTQKKPEKTGAIMQYFFLAAIALLGGMMTLLYLKQRELNGTLALLIEKESADDEEPPPAGAQARSTPTPAMEASRSPAMPETRGAEETAREVLGLYKAGMSIANIAEKLGIGQDEVRLILNLQREESKV